MHHYGVAVPFIAVAAASLSQLMHTREAGLGPLEDIPHMRDEPALQFDWEESIEISARARRALDFVARALRERGSAGQPIWPIVPSSLYCAFTEGRLRDLLVLVISYDASVFGWRAIIKESADSEGYAVAGGFREAHSLLGADFLLPLDRVSSPAAQVHCEGLACLLAAQTASQLFPLSHFTVLIREDYVGAFRDGDYADPHTSEELPRIMARRRGRRARLPRPTDSGLGGGADAAAPTEGSKGDYQPTRSHSHRWVADRSAGGRQPVNASARSGLASPSPLPCL